MSANTILVAEDEPTTLETLGHALLDAGFAVLHADKASSAVALFDSNDVSLLLTDIALPGSLDGVALAELMRRQKPQLPVVFLSGHFGRLAMADGLPPPSAFLVKPVSLEEVVSAVARLLATASR
jgi:DNA-binding response OmpR family regulator